MNRARWGKKRENTSGCCRECGHDLPPGKTGIEAFFCSMRCMVPAALWAVRRKGYAGAEYVAKRSTTKARRLERKAERRAAHEARVAEKRAAQ